MHGFCKGSNVIFSKGFWMTQGFQSSAFRFSVFCSRRLGYHQAQLPRQTPIRKPRRDLFTSDRGPPVIPGTRAQVHKDTRARQGHGKGTERARKGHGKGTARARQGNGKGTERARQGHGKGTARAQGHKGHKGTRARRHINIDIDINMDLYIDTYRKCNLTHS